MAWHAVLRHPVLALTAPREGLTEHRADSRVSAFVYGDVLVLAATLGVAPASIRSGEGVAVVVGTVVSTYLAHVLADVIGAVFEGHAWGQATMDELRDSVPIISAGLPSCALFGVAAAGWLSPIWAQALASGLLVARIGAIGMVYRRLRNPIRITQAVGLGVSAAAVAALATGVKLLVAH